MQLQSLKLLPLTVQEEMHLNENTLFDLDLKVTQDVAQYPLHHVTYLDTKFEVAMSNSKGDALPGVKVTQNVTHYPLHHVTYSGIKFKVATTKG